MICVPKLVRVQLSVVALNVQLASAFTHQLILECLTHKVTQIRSHITISWDVYYVISQYQLSNYRKTDKSEYHWSAHTFI